MRWSIRLGLTAAGAAWGVQAWSLDCPQDCDEADKVNGCCPKVRTTVPPTPPPRITTTKPPAASAERAPAGTLEVQSLGGIRMVRIPAGTFLMGSSEDDEEAFDDEKPQHTVTISRDFYLMETEVTQALWASVMGTAPWDQSDRRAYKGVSLVSPSYPAIYISWCDAVIFANALSTRDGLKKAYSYPSNFVKDLSNGSSCDNLANGVTWDKAADGYRLPTEAEWEYAAREGERATRYAGTSTLSRVCNYGNVGDATAKAKWTDWDGTFSCTDKHATLAPVGSFAASAWGLKDMTGNVWEWVFDTYEAESYSKSTVIDPVFYDGKPRVIRGGSWLRSPHYTRAASRHSWTLCCDYIGLRLARSAAAQP